MEGEEEEEEGYDPDLQARCEAAGKRARISTSSCIARNKPKPANGDISHSEDRSTERWIENIPWPEFSFDKGFEMSQSQLQFRKRSSSATSYAQSMKKGESPYAHSPEYERKVLAPAGIILDQQLGEAAVSADCKEMCASLTNANYEPPKDSLFDGDLFWKVMNSIRSRNEPRVVRDISQYVTPSAEHLELRGLLEAEHLREELQTEWHRCDSLAGPAPKPDLAVGLGLSAFTEKELKKMQNYGTFQKPTEVAESLFFPFLVCEAKVSSCPVNDHSASSLVYICANPFSAVWVN